MALGAGLNKSAIDGIVSDFIGAHKNYSADIDAAIARNQQAATLAATPTVAAGAVGAGGQNPGTSHGSFFGDIGAGIINTLTGGQDASGAPANPVQWALNLLATPVYMAGEAAHNIHENALHRGELGKSVGGNGDPSSLTSHAASIAADIGGVVGGLGRGLAEGAGIRFDGERARTMGDYTSALGVNEGVRQAVKGATGNQGVADFAGGATGFAADMAVPVPGIGAVAGTARGLAGAARGAENAAGETVRGVAGFRAGKAAYEAQVAAKAASKAEARAARAAAKNGNPVAAAEASAAAGTASAAANVESAAAATGTALAHPPAHFEPFMPHVAEGTALPAQGPLDLGELKVVGRGGGALPAAEGRLALPAAIPAAAAKGETVGEGAQRIIADLHASGDLIDGKPNPAIYGPNARARDAAQALLGTISSKGREVPAEQILAQAAAGAGKPLIDQATAAHLTTALKDAGKVPELEAAIKAAKKTATGKTFLAKQVLVDGKPATLEEVIRRAGMRRITGGDMKATVGGIGGKPGSGAAAQLIAERAIEVGQRIPAGKTTPESLLAAIHDYDPEASPDVAAVMKQLTAVKPADRPAILKTILGENQGEHFATFDDAIAAAVSGNVSAGHMRLMLKALGIPTRATSEETLAKLIGSRGVTKWSEIQAAIPTKVEVAAEHGMDDNVVAAADATDVVAVQDAARADAQEAAALAGEPLPLEAGAPSVAPAERVLAPTVEPAAPTAPQAPDFGGVGADFAAGTVERPLPFPSSVKSGTLREALARFDLRPHMTEVNSLASWRGFAVDILRGVSTRLNVRTGRAAEGLTGTARGEVGYPLLMARLQAGEAYLRSHGVMPYFKTKNGAPWYFSFGQVLEQLSPETVKAAFFDLNYRKSGFGAGGTDSAKEAFRGGLTVFPTTFAHGAIAALRGHDAAGIFHQMMTQGLRSDFEKLPAGEAALKRVATEMAAPGFREALQQLHDGQEVIALAFMNKAADDIVAPLADKMIAAVASYGDRSQVTNLIREAVEKAKGASPGLDDSLLRKLVDQRGKNGILAALMEHEGATVRADLRVSNGDAPSTQLARQADVWKRRIREKTATGAPANRTGSPASVAAGETAERNTAADSTRQLFEEQPDTADAVLDDLINDGREDTELAHTETILQVWQGMGIKQVFDRIGTALSGTHGMDDVKPLIAQFMSGTHVASQKYQAKIVSWALGGKTGDSFAFSRRQVVTGLMSRLEPELGHPPTEAELHDLTRTWMSALARHTGEHPTASEEELLQRLQEGAAADPRAPMELPEAPGLSPVQAQMALELHDLVMDVFSPVNGPLQRSGVTTSELMKHLTRHGVDKGHLPDPAETAGANAGIWRGFDYSVGANPLDMLLSWHRALEAASVPKSVGASLSAILSHSAQGLTKEEAIKAGWKRLDTNQKDRLIQAHVGAGDYFPPEVVAQLPYAENLLQQSMKTSIGSPEFHKYVVAPADFITSILKSSQTIWRPAHHIDNVLGDSLMNLMRGVHPKYVLQAPAIVKHLGQLQDVGDDVIGQLHAQHMGDLPIAPSDVAARVTVRGKVVELTHAQVAQLGVQRGALVTARQARDSLPGSDISSALGRSWVRRVQRANPLHHVDAALGQFSATRDNFTRVAHFLHVLEERSYASIEEAVAHSAADVNKWHPTIQTMSAFEQKYGRRVVYFYTWMRQTATVVLKTALEQPKAITAIPEMQYELAQANGLTPNSIGNPTPSNDPRVPSYASAGLLGPTFQAGYAPFNDPGEPGQFGDAPHAWGFSLSAPQIDSISSLFQGNPFSAMNPLISAPVELALNSQPNTAVKPDDNVGQFLFQQTGTPYSLAQAAGYSTKTAGKNANATDQAAFDLSQKGNQGRVALNFLTGAKFTDYSSISNAKNAKLEVSANRRAQLKAQGYSDADIAKISRQGG